MTITQSAVLSAGSLGAYVGAISIYGKGQKASTIAFMSLISSQLLHSLSCRSEKQTVFKAGATKPNIYLDAALAGSFALQGLAMFIPGLRNLLGIRPINLLDGVIIGSSTFLTLFVNEATKKS